jgi:CDP-archaeol synthase
LVFVLNNFPRPGVTRALESIKSQIETARSQTLPKHTVAVACNYTLTLWNRLTRFLDHLTLELSTDAALLEFKFQAGRKDLCGFAISCCRYKSVRPGLILRLLFLVMLANGMPVLAKKILGQHFSQPVDSGASYFDRQSLFGRSKTIRGILLSVLATTLGAHFLRLGCKTGVLVGCAAMAGDLFSSFLKRRMRLPASSRATGLDQVPESLLPLLACRRTLSLTPPEMTAAVIAFFIAELLLSRILYKFRIRDHPY